MASTLGPGEQSPGGVGGGTLTGRIWIPDLTRSLRKLPFLRRPEAELSFIDMRVRGGGRFYAPWQVRSY